MALAIGDEGRRASTLAAFLPFVADRVACLRSIRCAITNYLRQRLVDQQPRQCWVSATGEELLHAAYPLPGHSCRNCLHIIEICQEWEWL